MKKELQHSGQVSKPSEAFMSVDPLAGMLRLRMLDPPSHPGLLACLDRFEIHELVGYGGMGAVFKARDPKTGEIVAIKLLRKELAVNPRAVHRFLVEARHMQRMSHPNIVPVLEVSDRPEGPYFVMPYMSAGSLAGRLTPGTSCHSDIVLRVAGDIASALEHAHGRGIIHRDIKPANILFDNSENAYLTDFGLLRTVYNDSIVDVRRPQCEGTGPYMSPAVAAGQAEDTRCDIYAFGAVLYEMLTGVPPYEAPTVEAVLQAIQEGPPPAIRQRNANAPPALVQIAEGAMARNLRDRYAQISDVLADVKRIERGSDPIGPRSGQDDAKITYTCPHCQHTLETPAALAGQTVVCPDCHQTSVVPRGAARRLRLALAGLAAATIVVGLAFLFWPGGDKPGRLSGDNGGGNGSQLRPLEDSRIPPKAALLQGARQQARTLQVIAKVVLHQDRAPETLERFLAALKEAGKGGATLVFFGLPWKSAEATWDLDLEDGAWKGYGKAAPHSQGDRILVCAAGKANGDPSLAKMIAGRLRRPLFTRAMEEAALIKAIGPPEKIVRGEELSIHLDFRPSGITAREYDRLEYRDGMVVFLAQDGLVTWVGFDLARLPLGAWPRGTLLPGEYTLKWYVSGPFFGTGNPSDNVVTLAQGTNGPLVKYKTRVSPLRMGMGYVEFSGAHADESGLLFRGRIHRDGVVSGTLCGPVHDAMGGGIRRFYHGTFSLTKVMNDEAETDTASSTKAKP